MIMFKTWKISNVYLLLVQQSNVNHYTYTIPILVEQLNKKVADNVHEIAKKRKSTEMYVHPPCNYCRFEAVHAKVVLFDNYLYMYDNSFMHGCNL